jgi:hypothetical protein
MGDAFFGLMTAGLWVLVKPVTKSDHEKTNSTAFSSC